MEDNLLILNGWQAALFIFICSSVGAFWVYVYTEFLTGLRDRLRKGKANVTDQAE